MKSLKRNLPRIVCGAVLLSGIAAVGARAQSLPPVRQIGKLERVSSDSLGLLSARTAIALPGGRVMFDDLIGRRIVMLDSNLAHATVIADTTSATANAYGQNFATLIHFRGDSALLIVPSMLSMFVIAPNGAIARTMAIPRPSDANLLFGRWAEPGLDAKERLIYLGVANVLPGVMMLSGKIPVYSGGKPTAIGADLLSRMARAGDTAVVVRADLASRALDTAAWVHVPKFHRQFATDAQGFSTAIETTPDPMPILDLWTVMRDGTVAIVRGIDLHIDWIDASGHVTASPKIPFAWKKADDALKTQLVDSTVKRWQSQFDEAMADGGRRGGGRSQGLQLVAKRPALTDLPDYVPPFAEHSVTSDDDDNVWIRTSDIVDGRPVYYVVNRQGALIDRVQLPAFREVIGFGPGVIYMAVRRPDTKVHLERARVH
ncbi:MAG TPA: hypothetical protein VGM50_15480 [Gemmatimonadaceae bacterium]